MQYMQQKAPSGAFFMDRLLIFWIRSPEHHSASTLV